MKKTSNFLSSILNYNLDEIIYVDGDLNDKSVYLAKNLLKKYLLDKIQILPRIVNLELINAQKSKFQ